MEERLREFYKELDTYYDSCDYEGMEDYLMRKLRENEGACDACYYPMEVTVLNELGTMYRCIGKQEKSKVYFGEAVNRILTGIGKDTMEYATAVNNLAGTCRMMGEYEEAARYFEESMQVYEKIGGSESYYYMTALNNLGLVRLETRELEAAAACFGKVLPVMEKLQASRGGLESELAVTWCNLAVLSFFKGDDETALAQCGKSLALYEKVPEGRRGHLGAVYNLLGDIYSRAGRSEDARSAYRSSLQWTEKFYGRNHEYEITKKKLDEAGAARER